MDDFVELQEGIRRSESNTIPEVSSRLQIEGDIVRVRVVRVRVNESNCLFDGCDNEEISIDVWPAVATDVPDDDLNLFERFCEAVVLIEWNDAQKRSRMRFVIMLLRWVTENTAERVGILSNYRTEWDVSDIRRIKRTRKKFFLR